MQSNIRIVRECTTLIRIRIHIIFALWLNIDVDAKQENINYHWQ